MHVEMTDPEDAARACEALAGLGRVERPTERTPTRIGVRTTAGHAAIAPVVRALDEARRRGRVRRGRVADARRRVRRRHRLAPRGRGRDGAGRGAVTKEHRVVAALGRRALSVQFRRAQLLMPTFVLPLMLLAVIASGTSAAQGLQGFPDVESYLAFVVPGHDHPGHDPRRADGRDRDGLGHRVRLLRPPARRARAPHEPRARAARRHARALACCRRRSSCSSRCCSARRSPAASRACWPRSCWPPSRRSPWAACRRRSRCGPARCRCCRACSRSCS